MKVLINEYINNKRNSKLNIICLIFSVILCFMFLSFIEQNIVSGGLQNIKKQPVVYKDFTIDEKIIDKLQKNNNIKSFYVNYFFPKDLQKKIKVKEDPYINEILISYYDYKNDDSKFKLNDIKIPRKLSLMYDIKLGDKYNFDNKDFNIIGFTQSGLMNSFMISYPTAKNFNIPIESVHVIFDEFISDKDFREGSVELKNMLNAKKIEYGSTLKFPAEVTGLFSLSLLILVSVLNVIFIFMNILYDRTKQYFVYRFSGMTRWQFYKLLLFEVLLDFIISFTLAIIIFTLANELLVKGVLGVMRYQFRYKFISYVFVGYFAVYMVLIALGIRKYFNKSLMESYKR
ncbi:ABC transporter permease [Helcococcus kunzii]|uniref:ABC transporter permease n=1 Tax=Helcococcus kunzii TaxID=40091 RepID=UPI001BAF9FA3|nr:FtsX-like permease family protein [Helcococcus kunzii]QUY64663.1 ABC transporter permease [Helcococcus kunzii]